MAVMWREYMERYSAEHRRGKTEDWSFGKRTCGNMMSLMDTLPQSRCNFGPICIGAAGSAYKDRVFRVAFLKDRRVALEVYNAMNNSNYTNPDELSLRHWKNAACYGHEE